MRHGCKNLKLVVRIRLCYMEFQKQNFSDKAEKSLPPKLRRVGKHSAEDVSEFIGNAFQRRTRVRHAAFGGVNEPKTPFSGN